MEENTLTNNFENTRAVLAEYGAAVVEAYRAGLADQGKNASGKLSRKVRFQVKGDEDGLFAPAYVVELTLPAYWYNVEFGRQPCPPSKHWVPVDALKEWIRVKPIIPRPDDRGRIPTVDQLAFLINRAINDPDRRGGTPRRPGIPPTPVLKESVDQVNARFDPLIKAAIFKDMEVYLNEVLWSDFGSRDGARLSVVKGPHK